MEQMLDLMLVLQWGLSAEAATVKCLISTRMATVIKRTILLQQLLLTMVCMQHRRLAVQSAAQTSGVQPQR